MKGIGYKVKCWVKEYVNGLMVQGMKVLGRTVLRKDKGLWYMLTNLSIKESLKMTYQMDKEGKYLKMGLFIQGSFL
jgi:hypothetical protein